MKKSFIRSICAGMVATTIGLTFASAGDTLGGSHMKGEQYKLKDGIHLNEEYKNDGFMVGKGNDFKPLDNLTRAEFATILDRLFKFDNVKETKTFTDIQNHWAKSSIEKLASAGVINGVSATEFNPNGNLQLDHVCIMLDRILDTSSWKIEEYDINNDSFKGHTYEELLKKFISSGMLFEYSHMSDKYNPYDVIDRAEMIAILVPTIYDIGNVNIDNLRSMDEYITSNGLFTDRTDFDYPNTYFMLSLDMSAIKGE